MKATLCSRRLPNHRSPRVSTSVKLCKLPIGYILEVIFSLISHFVVFSEQQTKISLNTAQWFVSNANGSMVLPALVPGGIYSDLRRNNVLKQDILYGKNDVAYRWVGNENWTYTTSFTIDDNIARSQSVKLVLHGVDTISSIYLNGQEIGSTDNMFIRYKFDLKPHLKLAGLQNILAIKFESPVKYSARKSHLSIRNNRGKIIPPYCPSPAQRGECHINFIRKMQSSFSWDWGPAFPSMGIYKSVEVEFGSFGIIRDILVETKRLPPLIQQARTTTPSPQVIISSSIRHQVKTPTVNKTVPYVRAPPYYVALNSDNQHLMIDQTPPVIDITSSRDTGNQLLEENWLLKTTIVAEMVQPSFGYNLRIEFNLNGILHYESEHINVVANSDGFIRLGFNLRIDTSRMQIKPWWPNNAGGQTLYRLTAKMMPIPNPTIQSDRIHPDMTYRSVPIDESHSLKLRDSSPKTPAMMFLAAQHDPDNQSMHTSEKEIYFGFRTIELIQEPVTMGNPEDGLTFNFRVNDVDLFAMGSNWIPASILPEYSNDVEYVRYLLQSAKDANMNMLRVWGGGIYESDEFYKMADEMGIMIWHDLMFACALYPVEDDFLASVRMEVEQQVQRLQYHPSIILWAGNNENEMAIAGPWWPEVMAWNKKLREAYAKLYVDTIRPIVQILDPTRAYIESSPSNGLLSKSQPNAIAKTPNENRYGDVHHYDYIADSFDWTNYPSTRFASEYGFQSYPSFNALTSITPQNDWKYPLSSNILHRQHRTTGEFEMKHQIKMHFKETEPGGPDKLKTFIYVSQLTQAIAIKTETEFYRRNRFIDTDTKLGKTMGALYWQLNDVWQAPTWSSIEYGGKWKMLHYFARRFFFPIQVMPYLIQLPSSAGGGGQQPLSFAYPFNRPQGLQQVKETQLSSQIQAQQQPNNPSFVVDLVRDDLFNLIDSFNVTIRFYRWTSFAPVWQDTVYVKNTRPQNVTRIYEQDVSRILRHPGIVSPSSGVFHVLIEQQPRLGLSQIDNYLMPVVPARVTAMRVAKISIELIQGPFELTDLKMESQAERSSSQWTCAYRLTLVSDSIAMFVWLDLNLLSISDSVQDKEPTKDDQLKRPTPPEHIHLDALPSISAIEEAIERQHYLPFKAPERIQLHINGNDQPKILDDRRQGRRQPGYGSHRTNSRRQHESFRPLEGTGSNMFRYQFSDNAFNMFEPSKVIDLYLNRCLRRDQIEIALEIQSLADSL